MRTYEHQASAASGDEGAGQLFNKNYFKIVDLTAFKYVNISNFLKYLYEFTARSPRRRMLRLLDAHYIHIFACSAASPLPEKRRV